MFCPENCSWPDNCPCFTPEIPPTQEEVDAIVCDYVLLETSLEAHDM
jgi:hypothetical protein